MIVLLSWTSLGIMVMLLAFVGAAIVKGQVEWRMWQRSHLTQKQLTALMRRWRGAERDYAQQYQKWLDGERSVRGLEDLRMNLVEFYEVVEILIIGE